MIQLNQVFNDLGQNQFQLSIDGRTAFSVYHKEESVITFIHTDVPPDERGQAIGDALIEGALQHVRAEALRLVPLCLFVSAYIRRHPEVQDLLVDD